MLRTIRTGDILLCENKPCNKTNAYLIIYDVNNGFGLMSLFCGNVVGYYGFDRELFLRDITGFLHTKYIVPKEKVCEWLSSNYKCKYSMTTKEFVHIDSILNITLDDEIL